MRSVPWMILAAASIAWPRNVVVGTGDPSLDIPAVQAAVDRGGNVMLRGRFSFDAAPPKSTSSMGLLPHLASVLVTKAVVISGERDERGQMTSIERGTWPFAVQALRAHVTIQGLRFVRPRAGAIKVNAVGGLTIADCRIEGAEPLLSSDGSLSTGIGVATTPRPPTPEQPGRPENVSGRLSIVNNYVDVTGGTSADNTLGILIFSVGKADQQVEVHVSGNQIRNVTERAINLREISGSAHVERNAIDTGMISGPPGGIHPDAIHITGSGAYLVAHNSIHVAWAKGAGIRVHGRYAEWPIAGAIVADNDLILSAADRTDFDGNSAGIEIRGFAQDNLVLNNRIQGRARAALAVAAQDAGVPHNSTFLRNNTGGFQAELIEVFVEKGATNTLVKNRDRQGALLPAKTEGGREK